MSERAVPLTTIASEWGRVGTIGFGGPPTHIALLRRLCVERRYWLTDGEFEDGLAAVNLLPGPASTQLAIYLAWRLRGIAGALLGGACFICPGLVLILALAALFLDSPAHWVRGAGAGAGAAVAAVAVNAGLDLLLPAWRRVAGARRWRLLAYAVLGGAATALIGPWLVLALAACGLAELMLSGFSGSLVAVIPVPLQLAAATGGGLIALAWVAFKVGALSYGGGFVIVPLMQGDAVNHYHWLTGGQFLNAVALGQITPGPVVQTVAVVGYAAAGVGGGLLAALVAFAPSFSFVLIGAGRFQRLLGNVAVRAFLDGAGPAAIGAILGSAIPLARALQHGWQYPLLAAAAVSLLVARRGVVVTLLAAGAVGVGAALLGAPVSP